MADNISHAYKITYNFIVTGHNIGILHFKRKVLANATSSYCQTGNEITHALKLLR
jgi:hypothetical protein